jgi:hypothetical protein
LTLTPPNVRYGAVVSKDRSWPLGAARNISLPRIRSGVHTMGRLPLKSGWHPSQISRNAVNLAKIVIPTKTFPFEGSLSHQGFSGSALSAVLNERK